MLLMSGIVLGSLYAIWPFREPASPRAEEPLHATRTVPVWPESLDGGVLTSFALRGARGGHGDGHRSTGPAGDGRGLMPELPEVETTRRGIAPRLLGRRISRVEVREWRLRWPISRQVLTRLPGRRKLRTSAAEPSISSWRRTRAP